MLIKRQLKRGIVNLNCVEMVFVEEAGCDRDSGCGVYARGASGKSSMLGWYKDEARAQEVLQEIIEAYKTMAVEYEMPRE